MLHVEALDALLKGRMAAIAVARDWELLREVARLAQEDAPLELATTDPALYETWRAAVTRYHLKGWTHMTPERVDAVQQKAIARQRPASVAR
jgi:predicted ATPase